MIVRVSGGQLDRVVRCQASAALPQIIDANDEDKPDRNKGLAVHSFLERIPEVGREAALAEVPEEHRNICADIELAKLAAHLKMSREISIAYNWVKDTARLLTPDDQGRVDIDRSCEIAMRLDVVGFNEAERQVFVGDYKTGNGWLPDPEKSYQLGAGAVAAARLFGARSARVEYIRIRDDGTVRKWDATLDLFGLDGTAEAIAKAMSGTQELRDRILGGEIPNVVEGPWCRYCPARQHCPAKTALVRHVLGDPQPIPYAFPLTPEGALRAYVMLKKAKEAINQIDSALFAYAKLTPIPLGIEEDGSERWFGELRRQGSESFDGAITHQVITERFGGETANKVVTMETTKKAIVDAAREHLKPGEKITRVSEDIYKELRIRHQEKNIPLTKETCTTVEFTVDPSGEAKARKRKAAQ